jgi:hypothetical protein
MTESQEGAAFERTQGEGDDTVGRRQPARELGKGELFYRDQVDRYVGTQKCR